MYGAAKGTQMISRFGGRLLAETSKEVLANRGNWKGVDLFDAVTNSFLGNKLSIGWKIAVEGFNSLVDGSISRVSIYGLQNRFGKSGNQVGLDLMFSGLKIYSAAAFNGVGMSNQQIANHLVISEATVRTHVSNILSKLHLASRIQAALYALQEGLASLD